MILAVLEVLEWPARKVKLVLPVSPVRLVQLAILVRGARQVRLEAWCSGEAAHLEPLP